MRLIAWSVLLALFIFVPISVWGNDCSYYNQWKIEYSVMWPNHRDFVMLTKEGYPLLKKSLFNLPRDVYFGPETLARMGLEYERFVEWKRACLEFNNHYT